MTIFRNEPFISHAGLKLPYKIDCDDLTDEDIKTLAAIISRKWKFSRVFGITRGGLRLASALEKYCLPNSDYFRLIVDDVYTTGKSMREKRREIGTRSFGVVIYSRGKCPSWVKPIFILSSWARD